MYKFAGLITIRIPIYRICSSSIQNHEDSVYFPDVTNQFDPQQVLDDL